MNFDKSTNRYLYGYKFFRYLGLSIHLFYACKSKSLLINVVFTPLTTSIVYLVSEPTFFTDVLEISPLHFSASLLRSNYCKFQGLLPYILGLVSNPSNTLLHRTLVHGPSAISIPHSPYRSYKGSIGRQIIINIKFSEPKITSPPASQLGEGARHVWLHIS